ncbi:TRAP transporter substrate-binding protein [Fodinicurvata sp. EGI_FJ10296]|uniref:TRAP transporter substrate-binding protein n=1 Tax=Fodinicurvata sp. EGI_FJ10296 TaxID=3231908 RepID=UPI003454D9F8
MEAPKLTTGIATAALMAGIVGGGGLSAGAAGAETLRVANWLPPSHPIVRDMVQPWAANVEEATEGRVTVDILDAPLGPPPAHFDMAADGIADVTFGVHGYTPGRFTLTQMVEVPFLGDSAEALSVAYWRVHEEHLAEANEHEGVQVLGVFTHGPGHIFNTVQPVEAVEDLDGMKLRVGGGIVSQVADLLNVVTVPAPSTETYELLSNGVADGILFPHESVPFFNLEGVLEYGTIVPGGLYNTSFFFVMNADRFDALSAEDQEAIMSVSGEDFSRMAGRAWDEADAAGLEAIEEAGIEMITASDAMIDSLRETLSPVEEGLVESMNEAGVDGGAALEMFRAEVEAYEPGTE